ncbi:hypothetical protein OUZ56_008409 [Daphnia magna]|uniref:Uncharacterized protein n=1 Tax=Daphnia magna TaxID=35525 RepID=A0ABR0ACX9_9CRUS|nr:hypothetical protein OUZ56_008409 [Daphnia magna]
MDVHHDMTPDELRRVFHVDSHDQVPNYEVINLRSRVRRDAERDIRHVDLSAFGTRYNLRLERNEQLLRGGNKVRVWVADSPSADQMDGNRTQFGGITLEELPQRDLATCRVPLRKTLALSGVVQIDSSSLCPADVGWTGVQVKTHFFCFDSPFASVRYEAEFGLESFLTFHDTPRNSPSLRLSEGTAAQKLEKEESESGPPFALSRFQNDNKNWTASAH